MDELAKMTIKALENGDAKFIPDQWNKVSLDWLGKIKDWCISRQIWWGHRLPVWSKGEETIVSLESPGEGWIQSEDVWILGFLRHFGLLPRLAGRSRQTTLSIFIRTRLTLRPGIL